MEIMWLLAAAAVPLAFNPWGCNAFDLPKAALLLTLALLGGLAALVQMTRRPAGVTAPPRPLPWLLWPVSAFAVALILATVFSVNPYLSLWGSHQRQQGLLAVLACQGLFTLVAFGLRTRAQAERLLDAIAWGSLPVVAYGLWQAVAPDPLAWQTDAASPVHSTLGRANFLASYLVLALPLTVGRMAMARRRWPYALLLAAQLGCLILTRARGGWTGVAGALVILGVAWTLTRGHRRLAGAIAAGALVLAGVVAFPTLMRGDEGSASARLTIWRTSLPLIAQRPWLGYGPETTRAVFMPVYPPQLVYYQGRGLVVDRAHNLWLDLALNAGVAGMAAYGGLLAGFAWLAWRGLRTGDRRMDLLWWALAASLAAHVTDMQTGFETPASAALLWLLLGLAVAAGRGWESGRAPAQTERDSAAGSAKSAPLPATGSDTNTPRWVRALPLVAPVLAVLALVGMLCVRPVLADVACRQSQTEGLPAAQLAAAQRAVALWPVATEYHRQLADLYLIAGDLPAAQVQLTQAIALEPEDAVAWAAQGDLYAHRGYDGYAEAAYRRAIVLAPTVALTHRALGMALLRQGRLADGLAALERAVDLDATDGVAFYLLADGYRTLGDTARATWAWRQAVHWGF